MHHRYVQLSEYNLDRIYVSVMSIVETNRGSFVGRLPKDIQQIIFEELGLPFDHTSNVLLGIFRKGHKIEIHSDNHNGNIHRAITVPIKDCDSVYMNWYKALDESKIYKEGYQGRYKPVAKIPDETAELIESVCCNQPFVADINQWHSGENKGDGVGVMLSIRYWPFSGEPFNS